jgi:ligand-binding sensor domain-containing protein
MLNWAFDRVLQKLNNMKNINKQTFLSLLWVSVFFTSWNGQVKTDSSKENATIATGQPKLITTQGSPQPSDNIQCSLQDKAGNLWFGTTGEGLYKYDPARRSDSASLRAGGKSFTNFTTNDGLSSNTISSILEDKKGNIWVGTNAGLSYYDPSTARRSDSLRAGGKIFTHIPILLADDNYSSVENQHSNFVTSILEDKKGKLWLGTVNGVYCYDPSAPLRAGGKTFTRLLDNKSIINTNELTIGIVQCMLEDKQGNIWITTKTEGVCRYDGKSLINYTPNNELWFRGLLEDKNGNIWVGRRYKGVCRYDGKTFTNILQNGPFDSNTVLSIIEDKSENIWFGTEAGDLSKRETDGGLWVYNGTSFKNFSKKDGLPHNAVWSVLEDRSGNLWVGTRNTGLCRFDGKTFTSFLE